MIDGAKMQSTFDAVAATFGDADGTLNAVELSAALMAGGSSNGRLNRDQFYADAAALGLGEAEQQTAFASFGGDNANAASTVDVNDIVGRAQQYNGGQGSWNFEQFERFASGQPLQNATVGAASAAPAPATAPTQPATAETGAAASTSAQYQSAAMSPAVFDAGFYAYYNPDLAPNGVTETSQLEKHWLDHGIAEGRRASAGFDTQWCMKEYNLDSPQAVMSAYAGLSPEQQATVKTSALDRSQTYETQLVDEAGTNLLTEDGANQTRQMKMDIYTPAGASKSAPDSIPVVINLVGGGGGSSLHDADYMQVSSNLLSKEGFAVLTPQYHATGAGNKDVPADRDPAPVGAFPQSQYDLQGVMRYVRDNAQANHWDLNNITVMGFSNGGTIALNDALNPEYASAGLPKVKNVVAYSPGTNLSIDVMSRNGTVDDWIEPYMSSLHHDAPAGVEVSGNARWDNSPLKHLREADPLLPTVFAEKNFLLSFAADDQLCTPSQQFGEFVARLQMLVDDDKLEVDEHKSGGHVFMGTGPGSVDNQVAYYQTVSDWIKKQPAA